MFGLWYYKNSRDIFIFSFEEETMPCHFGYWNLYLFLCDANEQNREKERELWRVVICRCFCVTNYLFIVGEELHTHVVYLHGHWLLGNERIDHQRQQQQQRLRNHEEFITNFEFKLNRWVSRQFCPNFHFVSKYALYAYKSQSSWLHICQLAFVRTK